MVLSRRKRIPTFAGVLTDFAMNLPDGMPVVWLGRLKGAQAMETMLWPRFLP